MRPKHCYFSSRVNFFYGLYLTLIGLYLWIPENLVQNPLVQIVNGYLSPYLSRLQASEKWVGALMIANPPRIFLKTHNTRAPSGVQPFLSPQTALTPSLLP